DLHDDVGQLLSYGSVKLRELRAALGNASAAPPDFTALEQLLAQVRARVSSLSFQLSPPVLYDIGLLAAAQWLAEDLERTYGLSVQLDTGAELSGLDEATRITLFRALRELLLNVARHAETSEAFVQIRDQGEEVYVDVRDAGAGFDPHGSAGGFGLPSLRSR